MPFPRGKYRHNLGRDGKRGNMKEDGCRKTQEVLHPQTTRVDRQPCYVYRRQYNSLYAALHHSGRGMVAPLSCTVDLQRGKPALPPNAGAAMNTLGVSLVARA
eukprot:gene11924-biopygen6308